MDDWTNEEFLGYVDIHCRTPRALFSLQHVERLHALAQEPLEWRRPQHPPAFSAMDRYYALPLIKQARQHLALAQSKAAST
jgi:hypothetical protein